MAHKQSVGLPVAILFLSSLGTALAPAQARTNPDEAGPTVGATSRLAGDWRSTTSVVVAGSHAPVTQTAADLGASQPDAGLQRMLLLLAPSAAQQQALSAELANLQNPASPQYHQWLTPSAFAASYSNSASDVAAVSLWLQSQGLQVAPIPAGRAWVEFSGTVAQVEQAFQTKIHNVPTLNGPRAVLASSISVPAALRPVVQGLVSLDGAVSLPALTTPISVSTSPAELAAETSLAKAEALTPQLASQLLDLDSLHVAGVTGAGESIAIPARSNIAPGDFAAFRATFALPASPLKITFTGPDPGLSADQAEATLAASWAGAAAPGAKIVLVPTASTNATDGLDLSLAAIVDQALAHTVAIGYSSCEAALSPAHQSFYAALYEQASAQGMAVIAASGDSGAAACHPAGSSAPVSTGYGVNALASTPWNTAIGVASFSASGPAGGTSSLAAWSPATAADPAWASGGGQSTVYPVPAWQPAQTPTAQSSSARIVNTRLLPDLVLPAAVDSSLNPGLAFCLGGSSGCTLVRAGGSSASAALFAGVAALVAQKNGAQGNLAPNLYALSSQPGIFTDVQQGAAQLWCAAGSPGCGSNEQIGFAASAGFDLATGLGSVDAGALVRHWAQPEVTGTGLANVTNTTAPSQTINLSGSVVLSANVVSGTGGPAPTGTVAFFDQSTSGDVSTVALVPGTGETSTASVTVTGVLTQGGHPIVAQYSGDTVYAPANSQPVVVEAQPSATTTAVAASTTAPTPGSTFTVTATITSLTAGTGALPPSGNVDFRLDGVSQGSKAVVPGTPSTSSINMTAPFTAGNHQIVGFYSGDNNYTNSTSQAATISVAQSAPTVTVSPATTTPTVGSPLIVTATITAPYSGAAVATGTVTFLVDGATVTTSTIVSGVPSTATATITTPSIGTHTLQAVYNGDTNYSAVSSPNVTITVAKTPTTLTITPATTSPLAGSSLVVTAAISPGLISGLPTGSVTFTLDGVTVGTQTVSNGAASDTITVPTSGVHTIQASYSGDSGYSSSVSNSVSITVARTPTSTVVSASTTTPTPGASITVTATIAPTAYGSTQPTGSVTFTLDGVSEGVESVTPGTPSTASLTFTVPTSGSHALVATYSGDTYYGSSTATAVTLSIAKTATSLTVTPATTTPGAGSSLQVSAVITPLASNSSNPSGTVTFTLDGVVAGQATVVSGTPATATTSITVPSAGSHILGATYAGDTNFSPSTASTVALTVSKSTPAVVLTPATTTPSAGGTLQLSATITPPATGAAAPTGTINFTLDGVQLGTTLVVSGTPSTATITISTPGIGNHSLQAVYSGDGNYSAASSSAVTVTVSKAFTTIAVTPASTTPAAGSSMLVTATISATATGSIVPTGTVSFTLDGSTVGTGSVVSGTTATTLVTVPTTGTHTLQASYNGDGNFNSAISPAATFTVSRTTTTVSVVPSTTTPALGAAVPVTATINPTVTGSTQPTGTMTFNVDGAAAGFVTVTAGSPSSAAFTVPALSAGAHTISAVYGGDTFYAPATSTAVTITVAKTPTTIVVIPAATSIAAGAALQVSSTITPTTYASTPPTGTVSYTIDGVAASSGAVTAGNPSTSVVSLSSLTPGTHILLGIYSGDSNYATATSSATTITVAKSPTTTTVTSTTLTPTVGGTMLVSATVTATTPGTTSPTGTVTFAIDGTNVGSATVTAGSPSTASATIPISSAGAHVLTATYSGDTYYATSTAGTGVTITVAKGATTTTVTATPAALTLGITETLTATVAPTTAVTGTVYTITGTVSFYDGGSTLLGTATLVNDVATLTGVTLANNVNHTITAIYSGDTNWAASVSSTLALAATTLPDTVVLTSNLSTVPPGQALVLTATVTPNTAPPATGEQNPTGEVIFYDGTTILGEVPLVATALTNSSTATLTTQTAPGGVDSFTARYVGDSYYDAGVSNILSITVEGFTITPASTNSPTNLNIVQGSAGSAAYVLAGLGGFDNEIQIVCAVPAQDDMTCTATPQQVVPTGTVTFVVQTFTAGQAGAPILVKNNSQPLWPRAAGGMALAVLGSFFLPFGRRARIFLGRNTSRFLTLLLLLVGLGATGIGCTSNAALSAFGTPLGVATIKITASSYVDNTVVSQSIYLTVNVTANPALHQ